MLHIVYLLPAAADEAQWAEQLRKLEGCKPAAALPEHVATGTARGDGDHQQSIMMPIC